MKLAVITKNPGKIRTVNYVFSKYNLDFEFVDNKFPEIQAATSKEIAEHTALQMCEKLNLPVVREDASLFINALGFPGPFTAYLEKMIPAEKLLQMLKPFNNRSGYFEAAVVFARPGQEVKTFITKFEIEVNEQETGDLVPPKAWDRVLKFKGETRTFAQYPQEERLPIWAKSYEDLAKYIASLDKKV